MRKLLLLAVGSAPRSAPRPRPRRGGRGHHRQGHQAAGGLDKAKSLKAFTAKLQVAPPTSWHDFDFTMELFAAAGQVEGGHRHQHRRQAAADHSDFSTTARAGSAPTGRSWNWTRRPSRNTKAMVHVEAVTNCSRSKEDKACSCRPWGTRRWATRRGRRAGHQGRQARREPLFDKSTDLLLKASTWAIDQFSKQEVNQDQYRISMNVEHHRHLRRC